MGCAGQTSPIHRGIASKLIERKDLLPGGLLGSTAGGARADFDNTKGLTVGQECA